MRRQALATSSLPPQVSLRDSIKKLTKDQQAELKASSQESKPDPPITMEEMQAQLAAMPPEQRQAMLEGLDYFQEADNKAVRESMAATETARLTLEALFGSG